MYSVDGYFEYVKEKYREGYAECGENQYLHALQEGEIFILDMLRNSSRFRRIGCSCNMCDFCFDSRIIEEAIYIYTYNKLIVYDDGDINRAKHVAYIFLKNHGFIKF